MWPIGTRFPGTGLLYSASYNLIKPIIRTITKLVYFSKNALTAVLTLLGLEDKRCNLAHGAVPRRPIAGSRRRHKANFDARTVCTCLAINLIQAILVRICNHFRRCGVSYPGAKSDSLREKHLESIGIITYINIMDKVPVPLRDHCVIIIQTNNGPYIRRLAISGAAHTPHTESQQSDVTTGGEVNSICVAPVWTSIWLL